MDHTHHIVCDGFFVEPEIFSLGAVRAVPGVEVGAVHFLLHIGIHDSSGGFDRSPSTALHGLSVHRNESVRVEADPWLTCSSVDFEYHKILCSTYIFKVLGVAAEIKDGENLRPLLRKIQPVRVGTDRGVAQPKATTGRRQYQVGCDQRPRTEMKQRAGALDRYRVGITSLDRIPSTNNPWTACRALLILCLFDSMSRKGK